MDILDDSTISFAQMQNFEIEQTILSNNSETTSSDQMINEEPLIEQTVTIDFDKNDYTHIPQAEMIQFTKPGQKVNFILHLKNFTNKTFESHWSVRYNGKLNFTNQVLKKNIKPGEEFTLTVIGYYELNQTLRKMGEYKCAFNFQRDHTKRNELEKDFIFILRVL